MELIYYPDHDKRYAHINKRQRWEYPDEIHLGHPPLVQVIKRVKKFNDLTTEDVRKAGGVSACLLAKDVPFTKGCIH